MLPLGGPAERSAQPILPLIGIRVEIEIEIEIGWQMGLVEFHWCRAGCSPDWFPPELSPEQGQGRTDKMFLKKEFYQVYAILYKNLRLLAKQPVRKLLAWLGLPLYLYGCYLSTLVNLLPTYRFLQVSGHSRTLDTHEWLSSFILGAGSSRDRLELTLASRDGFQRSFRNWEVCDAELPVSAVVAVESVIDPAPVSAAVLHPETENVEYGFVESAAIEMLLDNTGIGWIMSKVAGRGRAPGILGRGVALTDASGILRMILEPFTIATYISIALAGMIGFFVLADRQNKLPRLFRMNGMSPAMYLLGQFWSIMAFILSFLVFPAFIVIGYALLKGRPLLNYTGVELLIKTGVFLAQVSNYAVIVIIANLFYQTEEAAAQASSSLLMLGSTIPIAIYALCSSGYLAKPLDWFWPIAFVPILSDSWLSCMMYEAGSGISFKTIFESAVIFWAVVGWLVQQALCLSVAYYITLVVMDESESYTEPLVRFFGGLRGRASRFFSTWAPGAATSGDAEALIDPDAHARSHESTLIDDDVLASAREVDLAAATGAQGLESLASGKGLLIQHVGKSYSGGKQAVVDVTFAVGHKRIFGLLGPNGAGKSTLLHIISGVHSASSGRIFIAGKDPVLNPGEAIRLVSLCPQHDIILPNLTCYEHLAIFSLLRGLPATRVAALKTLARVRLQKYLDTVASELSGGERRRLSIAMALSGDAPVILLDEPTTGLDPKVRRVIWDLVQEMRKDHLVVLTTHSMEEAELLSDELTIMAHGTLRCFGSPSHLKAKFGGQTFLTVSVQPSNCDEVAAALTARYSAFSLVFTSRDKRSLRFRYSGSKDGLLEIMDDLQKGQVSDGILSFGVRQSSLDDVFMNIVKEADADA